MDNNGDELVILLHIVEGINFDLKTDRIVLTASLGGNKMETEPKDSSASTQFNNNLVWETDKKSVKRMKTENLPIKLECFTSLNRNGQEVRSPIGYILLPIRGIPIISSSKAPYTKPHWYKLIGLNVEWRKKRPELLLILIITDKMSKDELILFKPVGSSREAQPIRQEPFEAVDMLKPQNGIHIELLQDEGLLQVGNTETDNDVFIVKLLFRVAKNLEQIVNPEEKMNSFFRFHYNLLGTPTHCALQPKGEGVYKIQEKIAINFRSSLKSLKEYFEKVLYIPIDLYYNDTIIGHSSFKFTNLIPTTNLTEFLEKYPAEIQHSMTISNSFPIEALFDLPPSVLQPYVEYGFTLKYMPSTRMGNCEVILGNPQRVEYLDKHAGGDQSDDQIELPPTEVQISENYQLREIKSDSITKNTNTPKQCKSVPTINEMISSNRNHHKFQSDTIKERHISDNKVDEGEKKLDMEIFLSENFAYSLKNVSRTFSFNLIVQTVKFQKRPDIGIWQISLHNSKADSAYTIANIELEEVSTNFIEFKNLELQLFFSSTPEEILSIISSESCILRINGPRGFHATADLDNEVLLASTKEKRSGVLLMENQSAEKVAMAHIFVYLDDLGINFNSHLRKSIPTSINQNHMDENLAYKIVEELEEWKQNQQEEFLIELKRKEINHLAMLSAEWRKKKLEEESKLSEKLDECTKLSEILEKATREIEERGIDQIEQNRYLEQAKIKAERNFEQKELVLNETIRRTKDDLEHQIKLENLKYKELDMSKNMLQDQYNFLNKNYQELQNQYNEMKKVHLPKEQLAGLFQDVKILSERLNETQKSKKFYKEQWAKIIREVHKMKLENLQNIENNLTCCKTDNLENFIHTEQNELIDQKNELNKLRTCFSSEDDDTDDL